MTSFLETIALIQIDFFCHLQLSKSCKTRNLACAEGMGTDQLCRIVVGISSQIG